MRVTTILALASLFGLAVAGSAQAGVVKWNFQTGGVNVHEKTIASTNGTVSVSVSAWSNTDPFTDPGDPAIIRHNAAGLGVGGGGSTQIDSRVAPFFAEWIAIGLPSGYRAKSVGISAINPSEQFLIFGSITPDISAGGPGVLENLFPGVLAGGPDNPDIYQLPSTDFPFILIGTTSNEAPSGFRVATFVAVPEPSTIGFLALGLLALGATVRRRVQAA